MMKSVRWCRGRIAKIKYFVNVNVVANVDVIIIIIAMVVVKMTVMLFVMLIVMLMDRYLVANYKS